MAANSLDFNQISTILNGIVKEATGQDNIAPQNGSEFITVAQTALMTGTDNLMNAVSQVLSRTIFSTRPYSRKFKGLEADSIRWGNHVRKINYVDGEWQDNGQLPINPEDDMGQQKPVKPNVVQTNFYGQNMYEVQNTIYRNQLYTAFEGPDQLGSFITGQIQNISDRIEQKHEALARSVIQNLVTGVVTIANGRQVVHLLTEYNQATGQELTAQTVRQPANYAPFMRWVYGRIAGISSMLTERTMLYHQNITNKPIMRHSPAETQRIFLYAPEQFQIDANVLSTTFHDNFLTMPVTERVNYWQAVTSPDEINFKPVYMAADGTLTSPEQAVEQKNVFGVIMDQEAASYTICDYTVDVAPYNAKHQFTNQFYHFVDRYWNDFTENAVVLLLD